VLTSAGVDRQDKAELVVLETGRMSDEFSEDIIDIGRDDGCRRTSFHGGRWAVGIAKL
jgi:hypothetical protein